MNFQPKLKEVEMKNMVKNICAAMVINLCAAGHLSATENNPNNDNKFMEENLNLTQEWDKTFPQSDMSYPDIGRHIYKLINVLLL
jgi:hypothetical protein